MGRRLAILDDNQCLLEERLAELRRVLPGLLSTRVCAALVVGSVASGRARDDSDIDLLLVLGDAQPRRSDYDWWDRKVAPHLDRLSGQRFPVQPVFIGRPSLATREPHLRLAIATGIPLWDPQGILQ